MNSWIPYWSLVAWAFSVPFHSTNNTQVTDSVALPLDVSRLEVAWQTATTNLLERSEGREILVDGGRVIWANAPAGKGFEIVCSNTRDGKERWRWQDFIVDADIPWSNYHFVYDGHYYLKAFGEIHAINLKNGQTTWQAHDKNLSGYIYRVGKHLYTQRFDQNFKPNKAEMRRTNLQSLCWSRVLSLDKHELAGYSPAIFGPQLWVAPNHDSVLVFQNRSWNFSTGDGKIDFCMYNLTQSKSELLLQDIEPSGNSNVLAPLVDGDRAYLVGQKNLHCIDLKSKKILWQKGFPGSGHHLMFSNLIVEGPRLIVKSDDDRIYAFDKKSGDLIWHQDSAGYSAGHMQFYQGHVYYIAESGGELYGVNTTSGQITLCAKSPNIGDKNCPKAKFHGGIAIDPALGLLFAHDRYKLIAIRLP